VAAGADRLRRTGHLGIGLSRQDAETWDAAEVDAVSRDDAETVGERGRSDPEIMGPWHVAASREAGPDLCMYARHGLGDGDGLQSSQQMLDEGPPPVPARTRGAERSVEQLADGDHADRALLRPGQSLEVRGSLFPLPVDQDIGVDQDGQELSGGPTDRRSSRTALANSSSTAGAEAKSSRKCSGDASRTLGGTITATGMPARDTSISSPFATRFSTSEKRRATSVALNLAMGPSLSDKSDY
jgi:hypothetical protein